MDDPHVAKSELILGGQKSGKTARAESLAAAWLAQSPSHHAVYIATAQAWDDEMGERIARHRQDRALRVPRMTTVEEPLELAAALTSNSRADTLVVVDCLTLWLTAILLPETGFSEEKTPPARAPWTYAAMVSGAIGPAPGPLVLVSNEIGLGVVPLGRETRTFVDALGVLNQQVAQACERVTLMAAGLPLFLKGAA